jgi:predicted metalloprotease with PDZ domain
MRRERVAGEAPQARRQVKVRHEARRLGRGCCLLAAAALATSGTFAQVSSTDPAQARAVAAGQAPVEYRLSFPEPEHHWMQVEVTFREVPAGALHVRMSRTSPGRYALHEFAKNVFDVRVRDGKGRELTPTRPDLHQWDVAGHDGTVVVTYRLFGDRIDGTYLAVDSTHAHMNIPATLVWARGFEARPARVRFEQPAGRSWRIATQLYPTEDALTFTAPNFHYLMDSPVEFSAHTVRSFSVPGPSPSSTAPTFRIALHHDGTDAEANALARDVERIVRETVAIFGEFPQYENNTYTFLSDYLPWSGGDGMEHRNSTVLTSAGALRNPGQRGGILGTIAHEFFHSWNMERIRSRDLEPFNFEEADVSRELWFGEGFTSYYDELIMRRAGLTPLEETLNSFAGLINAVTNSPGRQFRSAEDMSGIAPFVDAASAIDRTNWDNTFISYYTFGAAIGLAMDLSLRDTSNGRTTLDTFLQAVWTHFGRPGQKVPGLVATPYTTDDLKNVLAEVSGDASLADTFFRKFIQGREAVDYGPLLQRAGLLLRKRHPDRAYLGAATLSFQGGGGARVSEAVPFGSALYKAGADRDDLIVSIDGVGVVSQDAYEQVLAKHKPGDRATVRFVRRSGERVDATLTFEEDPNIEIVPVEEVRGGQLTPQQKAFRDAWLSSRASGLKPRQ